MKCEMSVREFEVILVHVSTVYYGCMVPLYSRLTRADQRETKGGDLNQYCRDIPDVRENLVLAPISKASARQGAGKAGRIRPGKCYRLYTEDYFVNEMSSHRIPEMQRSNLVSSVIQLKALGIDNILGFDWPASSSSESMVRASS
ncbi:putative RNA helicase [Helianthus annuus]|nr:putative RNA helicase [Helianthus annuus]